MKNKTIIFIIFGVIIIGLIGTYYVRAEGQSSWCYQESANVSTACGGLDSGNYRVSGDAWTNEGNLYDGNWDASATAPGPDGSSYLYINYTKPERGLSSSFWQVKDEGAIINLSINSNCWGQTPLQVRSHSNLYIPQIYVVWDCWNGTEWYELRENLGSANAYEEAMWWEIEPSSLLLKNQHLQIKDGHFKLDEN